MQISQVLRKLFSLYRIVIKTHPRFIKLFPDLCHTLITWIYAYNLAFWHLLSCYQPLVLTCKSFSCKIYYADRECLKLQEVEKIECDFFQQKYQMHLAMLPYYEWKEAFNDPGNFSISICKHSGFFICIFFSLHLKFQNASVSTCISNIYFMEFFHSTCFLYSAVWRRHLVDTWIFYSKSTCTG